MTLIQSEATIRDKNQVTIPREIAERQQLQPGQKLVIVDDSHQPGQFVVRIIPRTYDGALAVTWSPTTKPGRRNSRP